MTTEVVSVLVVLAVTAVVWSTIGRTMLAVAHAASELPVGPGFKLLADPLCTLHAVRLTEVVLWQADLIVGFADGHGSWIDGESFAGGQPVVAVNQEGVAGQLCFPHAAHDTRARRLLALWKSDGRALTAVINDQLGLVALVDETTREALTVDVATLGARPEARSQW